jgi:hypothetical protein
MSTAPDSITLQSGTFTGSAGSGAFARVIDQSGDTSTVDSTRTTTGGVSSTDVVVTTLNADGSITRDSTATSAQGGTVTTDITIGPLQNGVQVITGTVTLADGMQEQVNGAVFPTGSGGSDYMLLTDSTGQTATTTAAFMRDGDTTTRNTDGTNFSGGTVAQQSTTTILSTISGGTSDLIGGYAPAAGSMFFPSTDGDGAGAGIAPTTPPDLLSAGPQAF